MINKHLELIKTHLTQIICAIMVLVIVFSEMTTPESITVLFILTALQAARVIDYKYPERPDLYSQVEELKKKTDEHSVSLLAVQLKENKR